MSFGLTSSKKLVQQGRAGVGGREAKMIVKYEGAIHNGTMQGEGRAEYDDGEVGWAVGWDAVRLCTAAPRGCRTVESMSHTAPRTRLPSTSRSLHVSLVSPPITICTSFRVFAPAFCRALGARMDVSR